MNQCKMIIESQYFGCINFYAALAQNKQCIIEQHEYFLKMSFRNRCIVVGSNGLINLTVPIDGGRNNKQLMKDVKISYADNWQLQHWKTMVSSYAKAPFFEYYQLELETILKRKHQFLLDLNMEILFWSLSILKLKINVNFSDNYITQYANPIIDNRNKWLPKNYTDNANEFIKYGQVFEERLGFKKNVSIVDLIFSEGVNAVNKLFS